MKNQLDELHVPHWQNSIDLPSYLQEIVDQMRRGDYTQSCEALILTMDAETEIVTVIHWGEPSGLCSEETLKDIAKMSRTTA
jgi:hypothetical protein